MPAANVLALAVWAESSAEPKPSALNRSCTLGSACSSDSLIEAMLEESDAREVQRDEDRRIALLRSEADKEAHRKYVQAWRSLQKRTCPPEVAEAVAARSKVKKRGAFTPLYESWLQAGGDWAQVDLTQVATLTATRSDKSCLEARKVEDVLKMYGEELGRDLVARKKREGLVEDNPDFPGVESQQLVWVFISKQREVTEEKKETAARAFSARLCNKGAAALGLLGPESLLKDGVDSKPVPPPVPGNPPPKPAPQPNKPKNNRRSGL